MRKYIAYIYKITICNFIYIFVENLTNYVLIKKVRFAYFLVDIFDYIQKYV